MEHENRLTNEANVIQYIRSIMIQLRILASQYQQVFFEQCQEYYKDINAPSKAGQYTNLDEQRTALESKYDSVLSEIEIQLEIYKKFCIANQLDNSEPWNILLNDLIKYRAGIVSLSQRPLANNTTPSPSGIG
ncbi:hypothetical protein [Spirosoma endophyticum]|uniref:Uncharacterized protein n=1 Tax=Spirosoma endophyticum TaxID=662367 RepID=A0A1I2GRP1_9BACT|nr:hypothetical protein [Spirosoma endophyticum]SFF19719.1 hypothetical protein SAMN05216167_13443 [Spirosoma endophyticum]